MESLFFIFIGFLSYFIIRFLYKKISPWRIRVKIEEADAEIENVTLDMSQDWNKEEKRRSA